LQRELAKVRSGLWLLLEESGEFQGKDPNSRWIIDPLDGTSNFIITPFLIFVYRSALEQRNAAGKNEIVAGLIFDPILMICSPPKKAKGAFLNGRPCRYRRAHLWKRAAGNRYPRFPQKGDGDALICAQHRTRRGYSALFRRHRS